MTGAKWSLTAPFTGPAATQVQLIVALEEGKTPVSRSLVCFLKVRIIEVHAVKFSNFQCI